MTFILMTFYQHRLLLETNRLIKSISIVLVYYVSQINNRTFNVCVAGEFTLVDRRGQQIAGEAQGLLLYNGGTVCDDSFNENSANAVCRQMGYLLFCYLIFYKQFPFCIF